MTIQHCIAAIFLVSASVTGAYVLSGCHSGPTLTPQQAEGQRLFEVHCAHCHEQNDLGLKPAPPGLHRIFSQSTLPIDGAPATDAQIVKVIIYGQKMMPPFFGKVTDEQASNIAAYLHTY